MLHVSSAKDFFYVCWLFLDWLPVVIVPRVFPTSATKQKKDRRMCHTEKKKLCQNCLELIFNLIENKDFICY